MGKIPVNLKREMTLDDIKEIIDSLHNITVPKDAVDVLEIITESDKELNQVIDNSEKSNLPSVKSSADDASETKMRVEEQKERLENLSERIAILESIEDLVD